MVYERCVNRHCAMEYGVPPVAHRYMEYMEYGVPPVAHRYMDAIRMFGTHFATEVHFGAMTVVQARRTDSTLWPNQISAALPSQSAAVRPSAVRPSAVRPSAVRPSCLIGGRCHVPQLG
jgi:hypothetical protein